MICDYPAGDDTQANLIHSYYFITVQRERGIKSQVIKNSLVDNYVT